MPHPPSAPSAEPVIARGEDEVLLKERLKALIEDSASPSTDRLWSMSADRMGLERQLSFRTFKLCWEFMNLVAEQCQKEKHHPEWTNVYRNVSIRWTTHVPRGMSMKDIRMAEYCDFAECAVQNSPKELERLQNRDEITTEEFKLLVELSTSKNSGNGLPEAKLAGPAHPKEPEAVKEAHMNSEGALMGNSNGEQVTSTNSEAFRRRVEWMKRYRFPPTRLDTEVSLRP